MVSIESPPEVLPLLPVHPIGPSEDPADTGLDSYHAHCGIVYLECSRCGRYVGAENGDGFYGSVLCVCLDCQAKSRRAHAVVNSGKTAPWSYGVPCAGVRYYSYR